MAKAGMLKQIRQLCNLESMYFLNWVPLSTVSVDAETCSNLLEISSLLGIDALVIEFLNEISDNEAQKSAYDDALIFAARGARSDTMTLLLEKGANVDVRDESGIPVLHRAVISGDAEVVKLLLERGANVDALNGGGESALYAACYLDDRGIFELLLTYNADINSFSRGWGSPLFIAAFWRCGDIVRLLFERGARLRKEDWADSKGWNSGIGIVPTDELDRVYELVKDEDPGEYIRILIEQLAVF